MSYTPPFTITKLTNGWSISDATPQPVAGAPFGACAAFINPAGVVVIQQGLSQIFAGPIQSLAGLASGTNNVKFQDLINTFLGS